MAHQAKPGCPFRPSVGSHPGNWIVDAGGEINQPSMLFETARHVACKLSQTGRDALDEELHSHVFAERKINPALRLELESRAAAKRQAGHVNTAYAST